MQSSDISSAKYIDEDNLDLPRAISLENLSQPEAVHSEVEEQKAKSKTQSRFSTAIRKLSGSTKKKKKPKELPTTDNVLSSGAEDNTPSGGEESAKKSKNKLTQRFRIGSLGKSKRSLDDEIATKSIEISKTREVTSEHEHTIKTPEIAEISPSTSLPGSPRRSERIQKVQITISGKKIEHTKIDKKQRSITTTTTQITGGTRSETDYLIPSTAADTSCSATAENLEKEKIIASDSTTKPTILTSERLVIIKQSKYDNETPASSEQTAPTKPSRASDLPASTTTSARTAATLKLPTITKKLKGKTASGTKSKSKGNTQKTEANLMQNTAAGTPQRGHRLPKPEKVKTETPIELQSQSHASQSTTTNAAQAESGPPSYSPPPIPAANPTKETLSAEAAQATRYTSSLLIEPKTTITTTTTTVALAPLANISEAVVTVSNSSATDDKVSSAESVLPKDYAEQPRVQFAVGSAVSAQPKLVSLDIDLDYDLEPQLDSVGSNLSSDSATPLSDSSRKRIRYIAEPSITEEDLHSLVNRRENLVEEHKYSLDSDYEDYEAASVDNLQMSTFGDLTMDQEMEPVRKALLTYSPFNLIQSNRRYECNKNYLLT